MANTLKCPNCGEEIEITQALSQTIKADLEKELGEKVKNKTKYLEDELKLKDQKLAEAREAELNIRREKSKLEDEKKSFELDKQRQLDEERNKIRQQTLIEASDAHRLKDMEKEKMINDLKKSLEDAQQKASQGSQQLQGEVQEMDLEDYLQKAFPLDDINPVGKGVRGADISQIVKTSLGTICGTILWESKRTKVWVDDWATKLKSDMRASKSDISVIVTTVLPKNIKVGFGFYEGVWVTESAYAQPLAEILRKNLIDIAREKHNGKDRGTKADMIYTYLTSNAFVQQIQSIIEVHQSMEAQIQRERAAYEKLWKERESQAERILLSTAGIYGSIQGVAGQSLPSVKGLDLLEP
jgi:hypothetical protein